MIKLNDKNRDLCCGCEACKEICPTNCIVMEYDKEGFLFPNVDKDKCINCNKCVKVCPIFNEKFDINNIKNELEIYGAWNLDENIRRESTSGGVFSVLAEEILKDQGVVVGAIYDKDFNVIHSAIDTIEELYKFRGSKYVQSSTNGMYKYTKQELEKGRKVLYSGTPCQIEGLKKFLNREYENLITCGIICHGVPSPKIFKKYLEYLEKKFNNKIENINFRDKRISWNIPCFIIKFNNKVEYENIHYRDYYFNGFNNNLYLRKSCYQCQHKLNTDIIIGDFWGVENYFPEIDRQNGVSLIILTNNKIKNYFNNVQKKLNIFSFNNLKEVLRKNPNILYPSLKNDSRKEFFKDYNNMTFEEIINKYLETDWKKLTIKNFLFRVKRKIERKIKQISLKLCNFLKRDKE